MICFCVACDRQDRGVTVAARAPLSIEAIKVGMNDEEILDLLGEPGIKRPGPDGLELWSYLEKHENLARGSQLGGVRIMFRDHVVIEVVPIHVKVETNARMPGDKSASEN